MKKKDALLIGGVLLLAAALFLFLRLSAARTGYVSVYVHDELYARVSADDYQTITIDQGDGKINVIIIDKGGVRMESSTCKNQLCVHKGTIDPAHAGEIPLSDWIVCLPNGVSVSLSGKDGA